MSMKAIHIPTFATDPTLLTPSIIPRPKPREDQYVIKVTHCSPQHADILISQGKHQNNNPKHGDIHPPFTLGFDFAGIVESVPSYGAGRTPKSEPRSFQKGERVMGQVLGAFSEYVCVEARQIRNIPTNVSNEVACALIGQTVSYASVVHIAKVQKDEWVLISGASGGLGSVCCMVAKAVGAKVIALAGDEPKAQLMRDNMSDSLDAVVVLDGEKKWLKEVDSITNGHGADVILDNIGMIDDSIRAAAHFARIVILGFAARKGVMEEVKMNKILLKDISLIGYRFGETGKRRPEEFERIWKGYLDMLGKGVLNPSIYGNYKGLEDLGRALGDLAGRKVFGKVVIPVADERESAKL